MNNKAVIQVRGLSKQYRIGGRQERYKTLRSTVADAFVGPARRARQLLQGQASGAAGLTEKIWALQDVSFDVHHGDVIGIIGRNGAGKSTLLKILSRITEPTRGTVDLYGRVGSLLEVGTGFHPELTGRKNVYLNGAILGMPRAEIDRKFDEIIAFAEVDEFIDTPVKHYSSGMGLRLGFAVAAHLEPDILVVDEVLAVGDASFQRKCLGKMGDVANEGRTVLFVSHNMSAINTLCESCIWLEKGRVMAQGPTKDVISQYLGQDVNRQTQRTWTNPNEAPGGSLVKLYEVAVFSESNDQGQFTSTEAITVKLVFETFEPMEGFRIGYDLIADNGETIFRSLYNDRPDATDWIRIEPGVYEAVSTIPRNLLNQGYYYIKVVCGQHRVRQLFNLDRILSFEVVNLDGVDALFGGGANRGRHGLVAPLLDWQLDTKTPVVVPDIITAAAGKTP
jgi:lipopolysaccharide transport system ATP-binding protein